MQVSSVGKWSKGEAAAAASTTASTTTTPTATATPHNNHTTDSATRCKKEVLTQLSSSILQISKILATPIVIIRYQKTTTTGRCMAFAPEPCHFVPLKEIRPTRHPSGLDFGLGLKQRRGSGWASKNRSAEKHVLLEKEKRPFKQAKPYLSETYTFTLMVKGPSGPPKRVWIRNPLLCGTSLNTRVPPNVSLRLHLVLRIKVCGSKPNG